MAPGLSSLEQKFRVIIVGGSIAGLVFAHCLDKAGIEYLVLERNEEISPQVGASIGIMPNGGKILDQLGIYDTIEAEIEPLDRSHICFPDGFSFTSNFPTLFRERFGYPVAFLDREKLLDILYNALSDKSKVHLEKKVIKIDQVKGKVRVFTSDGCCYDGNLVVGADGVHSKVRSEMWRIADTLRPGLITSREKNKMCAEYACIFGISTPVPGLIAGEQVTCFFEKLSILTFHGKGGRVFWFILQKMDRKYYYPNVPRYSKLDGERVCKGLLTKKIWGDITFAQIWACREVCSMTAVEENVFQHWYFGRIVCIGDSMHKMTPNLGQGANNAIESAAALANTLNDMINIRHIKKPSNSEIDARLCSFLAHRIDRTTMLVKTAAFVTRLQARDGLVNWLLGRYFAPYAGDLPADMSSELMLGAETLSYIPFPARSQTGWIQEPSWTGRIFKALLFLVLGAIAIRVLNTCWGLPNSMNV